MIFWEDRPSLILIMEIYCECFHAVFIKLYINRRQKLLSCFEDILELSKYHRGQQKTNCLRICLIYIAWHQQTGIFLFIRESSKPFYELRETALPRGTWKRRDPFLLRQGYSSEKLRLANSLIYPTQKIPNVKNVCLCVENIVSSHVLLHWGNMQEG